MSNSLISLGLGFGGGKASTSSGRIDSGLATPSISVVQLGDDGATISTTGVSGATSYTYERDTSSSFSSPTTVSSGTLDLSVNDSGLSQGTLYYYRIIATDGVDTSTSATASLLILAVFTTSTLTDGGNLASNDNPFTFTVQPSTNISAGGTLTIAGLTGSGTADNASLTVGGAGATIFGSSADWTQSTGTLVLTVAGGQTLSTGSDTVVTFTLTNSSSSSGVTSATLSASGFVSATMTGDYLEAFANRYNIPDSTDQQTEATILALSPTNPTDEVTVKFGSDTYDLYVWDGSAWYIYNNDFPYSVDLDGADDVIDVGDITAINSASNISISGWFYASSFPHSLYNSLWGGGAGYDLHTTRFWLSCNNSSSFKIFFGTSTIFTFSYSISTGTWYHVVFTLDGSTAKLYVNGSQAGSTVTTAPSLTSQSGNNFEFGGNPTYRPYLWDGLIDETAIFNSTLSASDITSIYNSGTPADLSSYSPVHWWRMGDNDGGTGTTITDQGSGGNNGTLTNGPTFSTTVPS